MPPVPIGKQMIRFLYPVALAIVLAMEAGGSAAITITGPTETLPGDMIGVKVLDDGEPYEGKVRWMIMPLAAEQRSISFGPVAGVAMRTPGEVTFIAILWDQQKALKHVVVNGGLEPDPPGPNPPEPGPVPGEKQQVAYIMESADLAGLSRDQQTMLASLALRVELSKAGHGFLGNLDPSRSQGAPAAYAPWFEAAEGKTLPVVVLKGVTSGKYTVHPLPDDDAGLWKLLGGKP